MTILVVGATGVLGRAVTLALLRDGKRVRAMVRDPMRAGDLAAAGAELVDGDLTDAASLERACDGALRVFAAAHALLGRGRQSSAQVDHVGHSALIAAARGAGVARFVYVSAMGAREDHPIDFWRTKFEIEEGLRDSGLAHTILRPSAFMEWHVHRLLGQQLLERGRAVLIGPATKPRNFVSVQDVVPLALRALESDALAGRTLDIGGPDNLSLRDVAMMYVVRMRRERARVHHLPLAVARALAPVVRPFHEGVARVLDIALVPDADWPETFDPRAMLAEFPRELTSVDHFVDERLRAWRRARAGRR